MSAALILAPNGMLAQPDHKKPIVSDRPLTDEQAAVYRVVLESYLQDQKSGLNLSIRTEPIATEGPFAVAACSDGLAMEHLDAGLVHSFRTDDLSRLGFPSMHLVDPDQQAKKVKNNDPGKAIRKGASVDDAVKKGFAHALFSFSEIWFDKQHEHAIVSYTFWCGSLCGNGGSIVLEKKGDNWTIGKECGGWIS